MPDGPADAAIEGQPESRPFWQVPAEFTLHTVVGTCIFVIIAIPAILLDIGVRGLEGRHISGVIKYGLKSAEYSLFGTDLLLFLIFLLKTAWRTAKAL